MYFFSSFPLFFSLRKSVDWVCYRSYIFAASFYYWPIVLVLNSCNGKATSNNPVMDSTITSGIEYLECFFLPSGKWTPPVHLPWSRRCPLTGVSIVYGQKRNFSNPEKFPPVNSNFAGNMTSIYGLQLSRLTNDIRGFPLGLLTYALLVCFLRTSHMFLCRGKCFWFKNLAIFLVSMIDLRIRSTRKRRMCSCPHLKDFKKADGLKVFRKIHAHFVCCGSREARKRKVYTL